MSQQDELATHVTVGVRYGNYCFILLSWRDTRNTSGKEKIAAAALMEVKNRIGNTGIFTPGCCTDIDKVFKVFVGVSSSNLIHQQTFNEACVTMLKASEDTRPIRYSLLPLTTFSDHFDLLDVSILGRVIGILVTAVHHKLVLKYLTNSAEGAKYSVLYDEINTNIQNFAGIVLNVRRGMSKEDELLKAIERWGKKFENDESALNLNNACDVYQSVLLKEFFASKGFILTSYKELKSKKEEEKFYVVFADIDTIDLSENKNVALLKRLSDDATKSFFLVDNKDTDESKLRNKCHRFERGKVNKHDLLETIGKDLDKNLIKSEKKQKELLKHPTVSTPAVLKCPNSSCSENPSEQWICFYCSSNYLRYSSEINSFFCLVCKLTIPINDAVFRCSNISHSVHFEKGSSMTESDVKKLEETEEKNILILGETGVGKSTWINGIRNYLEFENLNDAVKNGAPIALIPSKFTYTDKTGQSFDISVGSSDDSNERHDVGRSNTKQPQSYTFTRDNGQVINLIDTPGLCDTENIDEENFKNILSHIKRYDSIHAICILLKPNNARLTVIFRYCINELLTHFHKGAVDNIIFCFTNSRSTFYCPGDTLPPLQKLLKEHKLDILDTEDARTERMFCLDNEAFRFLALLKSGIGMSPDQFTDYGNSWKQSVTETNRLFNKIQNLVGHATKQTLNINQARDIIIKMAKPLAEISQAIHKSIAAIKEAEHKGELINNTAKDLEDKLHFQGIDVVRKNLPKPRTVCTDAACIERITVGKAQKQIVIYPQHCHPECYLKGISPETINDNRLINCKAITKSTGVCHQCNHHYTQHMHITYELMEEKKDFMSDKIKSEIEKKETLKEKNDEFIRQKNNLLNELKEEHDEVIDASAKFACFLKESAILYYNDAVEEYLKHLLIEERNKDPHLQNQSHILKIENSKETYVMRREMLDQAVKKDIVVDGIDFSDPNLVVKLQKELYGLRHYGVTLKRIIEDGQDDLLATSKFVRIVVPSKPKIRTKDTGLLSVFRSGTDYLFGSNSSTSTNQYGYQRHHPDPQSYANNSASRWQNQHDGNNFAQSPQARRRETYYDCIQDLAVFDDTSSVQNGYGNHGNAEQIRPNNYGNTSCYRPGNYGQKYNSYSNSQSAQDTFPENPGAHDTSPENPGNVGSGGLVQLYRSVRKKIENGFRS